jgi:hypothetical protein
MPVYTPRIRSERHELACQLGSKHSRANVTVSPKQETPYHPLCLLTVVPTDILNDVMSDVEYFNDADTPNPGNPSWARWDAKSFNRVGSFEGNGDPGRQRLTTYPNRRPYLIHGENTANDHIDWYHKRNFTLVLVNAQAGQTAFGGETFSTGQRIDTATTPITSAAWIMCAVSLRGQARYKFSGRFNGYCWDGTSTTPALSRSTLAFQRLKYWGCKIDFVGAAFVSKKRAAPIGYFHDEAVYGIELIGDAPVMEIDVPIGDVPLPDSRTSFPLS